MPPVDLILSDRDVLQPDLVLVRRDRLDILSKKGITGIPDLVIEILSPSTLKRDKLDKLKTYARFELPEYWVVEPEQGVLEQYVLNERKYELCNLFQGPDAVTSSRLPCIRFTMEEILDSIPDIKD